MQHVLDNPIYNALVTGNSHLSLGVGPVRYFTKEISPFAGIGSLDDNPFGKLAEMAPPKSIFATITAQSIAIQAPWVVIHHSIILQMTGQHIKLPTEINKEIVSLGPSDVGQMLSLTKLTNPGPFLARTIEFGGYLGIFNGQQLVAMAGHRLHAGPYKEISAVCTHPDFTGKGYGKALMLYEVRQIIQQGCIPFLHTRMDNHTAISLYKKLGFVERSEMHLNIIKID